MRPYAAELEMAYDSQRPLRTFFRLLNQRKLPHLALYGLFFLKMLPQLLLPVLLAESIRIVTQEPDNAAEQLLWTYGFFMLTLLGNIPLHMLYVRFTSNAIRSMELRLRAAMVRRVQHLSMRFHSDSESGKLQSKVLRDVDEIVRMSELYFTTLVGAVLLILFAIIYTFKTEPMMVLSYFVTVPMAVGLIQIFRRSMRRRSDDLRTEVETMSQRITEMIDMVPVTRAHGLEAVEMQDVEHRLKHVKRRGHRVDGVNALFGSSAFVTLYTSIITIMGITTALVLYGHVTVDKIALYFGLFQGIVQTINGIVMMMPQYTKSFSAIRSLGEILECPDLEENEGKQLVHHVHGGVEFREIRFTYPGKGVPAVDQFSLKVKPGSCVAFVGESGSGKSTLMQLAIGFLRPQEGEILLDGQDMSTLDMRSWRRHIAMVPQNTVLFSGTVRDNITYGLSGYTQKQVWSAIRAAHLQQVIEQMPEGLETKVGENGLKLSGGQRQRLAIARAIIRDPSLMIFDEATSALDVLSEREVQAAIDGVIKGRTTFIVAHRLSTIRQADLVVVMENGRAVEVGPPAELAHNNGAFAKLKALQS